MSDEESESTNRACTARSNTIGEAMAERAEIEKPPQLTAGNLKALAELQVTHAEAAAFFGISERTFYRKLKKPRLLSAWNRGRANGLTSLRRLQWRHASSVGSSAVAMAVHLSKHWLGEHDRQKHEVGGPNGGPIPIFDMTKMKDLTAEELDQLERLVKKLGGPAGAVSTPDDRGD